MLGLVLGVGYWIYLAFMNDAANLTPEAALLQVTGLLFIYYCLTGIIMFFKSVVMGLASAKKLTAASNMTESLLGRRFGGLSALPSSGEVWVILVKSLFWAAIYLSVFVIGAWLLAHSGTAGQTFPQFNHVMLAAGGGLLLVGVVWQRRVHRRNRD